MGVGREGRCVPAGWPRSGAACGQVAGERLARGRGVVPESPVGCQGGPMWGGGCVRRLRTTWLVAGALPGANLMIVGEAGSAAGAVGGGRKSLKRRSYVCVQRLGGEQREREQPRRSWRLQRGMRWWRGHHSAERSPALVSCRPPPCAASVRICRSDTPRRPQWSRRSPPQPRPSPFSPDPPIASPSASLQGRGQHSSPLTFLSSWIIGVVVNYFQGSGVQGRVIAFSAPTHLPARGGREDGYPAGEVPSTRLLGIWAGSGAVRVGGSTWNLGLVPVPPPHPSPLTLCSAGRVGGGRGGIAFPRRVSPLQEEEPPGRPGEGPWA